MGYEKERKHAVHGVGAHSGVARFCFSLGIIFAVLGIIAAVANTTLGLGAMNWLLLAVVVCGLGIIMMIFWAIGMYLHATEAESKKEK